MSILTIQAVLKSAEDDAADSKGIDDLKTFECELQAMQAQGVGSGSIVVETVHVEAKFYPGRQYWTREGFEGITYLKGVVGYVGLITPFVTALGAWLAGRSGRKVRIKIGEIEVEANTQADVEKLLARALKVKQDGEPSKIVKP